MQARCHHVAVTMREDCRHFQSRTYETGEVARFCVLNLAPEAPWRCPEACPKYQPDIIDGSFVVGSLQRPPVEAEPEEPAENVAALLDEASSIVTAAGPAILDEIEAERARRKWWKVWKRRDEGDGFRLSNR
ncbi:MAG: hypothetical protein JO337_05815 [Acidimicrobiales bacterium]|nr:hypothetical protein [Acidimicrobiales bacterium]